MQGEGPLLLFAGEHHIYHTLSLLPVQSLFASTVTSIYANICTAFLDHIASVFMIKCTLALSGGDHVAICDRGDCSDHAARKGAANQVLC